MFGIAARSSTAQNEEKIPLLHIYL
jgi:hypothetical protein